MDSAFVVRLEAGLFDVQVVIADGEVGEAVESCAVGLHRGLHAGGGVGRRDGGARNYRAAGVGDNPRYAAGDAGPSDGRTQQQHDDEDREKRSAHAHSGTSSKVSLDCVAAAVGRRSRVELSLGERFP